MRKNETILHEVNVNSYELKNGEKERKTQHPMKNIHFMQLCLTCV